ncbi:MAG: SCP2 sterol-binding domain-containing protein [Thermoplasmataceae archaeon]|jgi:putative sterol carrier protein
MPIFPSDEWVKEYVAKINSNEKYADAASDWEGDFLFIIEDDSSKKPVASIYLDLYHGKCRSGKFLDKGDGEQAAFSYIGPYRNWVRLIKREIDPIQGVLTGKFKLKGPMMKIMRYTRAAKELVNTANQVETEFK